MRARSAKAGHRGETTSAALHHRQSYMRVGKAAAMTFGECIAAARASSGLTQKQVAKKLGVVQSCYAQWESGTRTLDEERLQRVAKALGCSVAHILKPLGASKPRRRARA